MVFERTLIDLIKGIRSHANDEEAFIATCLLECRKEATSQDADLKSEAILKLAYLEMLGVDISWASFQIVEVMSSSKILQKQKGYLAAVQSFKPDTDVLMLTTNLLKKDLMSSKVPEITLAIDGLSHFSTLGLARDLYRDVLILLNHSVPYVRKRTILLLYRLCLQYPEAISACIPKLRERLDDPDTSVVNAAVSVICELARRAPKNYLEFAPDLFHLLTTSSNNWMLIKLIKLFASLTPYEPRLVKKLIPSLTDIIENTHAMSLLYECINTIVSGNMLVGHSQCDKLASLCASKLRGFFEDTDQNLKYIALLCLRKLANTHPSLVSAQLDIILKCLVDTDTSIRLRALDLVNEIVNKENIRTIVKTLMLQLIVSSDESAVEDIRNSTATRIIEMTSKSTYMNIADFEWLLTVYVDLANIPGIDTGTLLNNQIIDLCVRVKALRPFSVDIFSQAILDPSYVSTTDCSVSEKRTDILPAIIWCLGEYAEFIEEYLDILDALTRPSFKKCSNLAHRLLLQAITKIFCQWCLEEEPTWGVEKFGLVKLWVEKIVSFIEQFLNFQDMEIQRRASEFYILFNQVSDIVNTSDTMEVLELQKKPPYIVQNTMYKLFFGEPLNPVAVKAQRKVMPDENLDLNCPINGVIEVPKELLENIIQSDDSLINFDTEVPSSGIDTFSKKQFNSLESVPVQRDLSSPFYLSSNQHTTTTNSEPENLNVETSMSDEAFNADKVTKVTKNKRRRKIFTSPSLQAMVVAQDEVPEGISLADIENKENPSNSNVYSLISLDPPLSTNQGSMGDIVLETKSPIRVEKKKSKKKKKKKV
ncbi:AP-3 complex subunit delta [Schizosaccharomyces pombe]